jgi:hypothetical protein
MTHFKLVKKLKSKNSFLISDEVISKSGLTQFFLLYIFTISFNARQAADSPMLMRWQVLDLRLFF